LHACRRYCCCHALSNLNGIMFSVSGSDDVILAAACWWWW
jgi:hypothetical protein